MNVLPGVWRSGILSASSVLRCFTWSARWLTRFIFFVACLPVRFGLPVVRARNWRGRKNGVNIFVQDRRKRRHSLALSSLGMAGARAVLALVADGLGLTFGCSISRMANRTISLFALLPAVAISLLLPRLKEKMKTKE